MLLRLLFALFFLNFACRANQGHFGDAKWVQGSSRQDGLFVCAFTAPAAFLKAEAVVSGIGAFEHHLNGKQIAPNNFLEPGMTNFAVLSLFTVEDVTSMIVAEQPSQIFGIQLGNGWYGMQDGYNQQPKLIAAICFTLSNGTLFYAAQTGVAAQCLEGSGWLSTQGPIVFNGIYNGETYDSSKEIPNWDTVWPGINSTMWNPVQSLPSFSPALQQRKFPPIKLAAEALKPVNSWSPVSGIAVYDFGREFSGVCEITVNGTTGSVMLHHGEILNHYVPSQEKFVYFANLRSAKALDTFMMNSSVSKTYSYRPKFTYHGFRFVQVNFTGDAQLLSIAAFPASTAVTRISNFSANNEVLDTLHQHVLWGQQSNLMSYPSDCDQRDERLGWMADGWLSSDEATLNFDMEEFYLSWVRSIVVDQVNLTGAVGDVTPFVRFGSRPADPTWGFALPRLVWHLNLVYFGGDVSMMQQFYVPVRRWWALLVEREAGSGMKNMYGFYGDWVPPPPAQKVSNSFVSAFSTIMTTSIAQWMAKSLLLPDAAMMASVLDRQCASFVKAFYNATTQEFDIGSVQATFTFPAILNTVCPSSVISASVLCKLLDSVERTDYHLDTGIVSLTFLLNYVLPTSLSRPDIALKIVSQPTYPSYAWEWSGENETAATTLWEVWDAPDEGPGMDSRNHIMDGSVDYFLQNFIGGIHSQSFLSSQEANAIFIEPTLATHHTPIFRSKSSRIVFGRPERSRRTSKKISVEWEKQGGTLCVDVSGNAAIDLHCGDSTISAVNFASLGSPRGTCRESGHVGSLQQHTAWKRAFTSLCIGKSSCSVNASVWHSLAYEHGVSHQSRDSAGRPIPIRAMLRAACSFDVSYNLLTTVEGTMPSRPVIVNVPIRHISGPVAVTYERSKHGVGAQMERKKFQFAESVEEYFPFPLGEAEEGKHHFHAMSLQNSSVNRNAKVSRQHSRICLQCDSGKHLTRKYHAVSLFDFFHKPGIVKGLREMEEACALKGPACCFETTAPLSAIENIDIEWRCI